MPIRPELSPTRALVWLYMPPAQRPVFQALCGIEAEIAASLKPGLDHEVAHARLAWWGEECDRTASGAPTHPLTRALVASVASGEISALARLRGVVDVATWDLAAATCETRTQLTAYCERWAQAMIAPLVPSTLAPSPAIGSTCVKVGATLHEIQLLARLADDARVGRLRLPLADLAAVSARPEDLASPPWREPLASFLRSRHHELRAQLGVTVGQIPQHAQPHLPGILVWARLAAELSRRCARALPRALEARDHHGPLDSWRAWGSARRAASGHFVLTEG